jgi:hypothetical protein
MPAKQGHGRYFLAALLLVIESPILFVMAVGAVLSAALIAVDRAAQVVARLIHGTGSDSKA